jgi:hypothetical protein
MKNQMNRGSISVTITSLLGRAWFPAWFEQCQSPLIVDLCTLCTETKEAFFVGFVASVWS